MKKFNFSLQKILDYREFEKQQAQTELGKAVAVETKIQNTLDMIAESRAKSVLEADKMKDLNSLFGVNQYFQLLNQRRDEMTEELLKAKVVTNEKRAVMIEAMKKVKVLETLRDRRKESWRREQLKIEEDQIDDIVTSRYGYFGDASPSSDSPLNQFS
nr:flagellar export protein FliJ [Treponema sp.]